MEDLVSIAAALRWRILTGSTTRLTVTVSELLREFGKDTLDVRTAATVGAALTTSGLSCRPDLTAVLPPDARVVLKPVDVSTPFENSPEAAGGGSEAAVLVSTTFGIPGYEIVDFHGEVFGLVVRSRNLMANVGASAKAIVGGELRGLTKLLTDGRNQALLRMRGEALARGANAVVGLRYDTSEIGDAANEVVAYGTAVTVRRFESGPQSLT